MPNLTTVKRDNVYQRYENARVAADLLASASPKHITIYVGRLGAEYHVLIGACPIWFQHLYSVRGMR